MLIQVWQPAGCQALVLAWTFTYGHGGLPVATARIRAHGSPHSAGSPCFLFVRKWHPACTNATEQRSARTIFQTDLYQWVRLLSEISRREPRLAQSGT